MAAKTRKNSIHVVYEGYREEYFLEYLESHSHVRLNKLFCSGGSANQIIINGIKHSARDVNVYVFFDEDFESMSDQKISQYKAEIAKQKQSDPNYHQRRRSLEEKISEYGRNKNRAIFMRFLSEKLPLPVITAKRADVPEADILLKAFGL